MAALGRPSCTFSIAACDAETGALGVAVHSRFFNVGAVVPWVETGAGAVATQGFADPAYGARGLAALRSGASAAEALKLLLEQDPGRELRQVAFVDVRGGAAAHTGSLCIPHAGHRVGVGFAVQGNLLASPAVVEAMERGYAHARRPFPGRLLAALEAAERAGGDARGRQSAALVVVRPAPPDALWHARWIDLRVEDHRQPVRELARLLRLRLAYDALGRAQEALAAGHRAEAERLRLEALHLSRRHDEILFWIGLLLAQRGEEEAAVEMLRAAIARNRRWRAVLARLPAPLRPGVAVLQRAARRFEPRRRTEPLG